MARPTGGDDSPATAPPPAAPPPATADGPPPAAKTDAASAADRKRVVRKGGEGMPPAVRLDDLYRLAMPKLFKLAEGEGIVEHTGMNRAQLIVGIVRRQIERGEIVRGSGTLEVLPDGYGFLRSQAHNYLASPEDIYVSPSQIRRVSLRTGLVVEGPIRRPIARQENVPLLHLQPAESQPPR